MSAKSLIVAGALVAVAASAAEFSDQTTYYVDVATRLTPGQLKSEVDKYLGYTSLYVNEGCEEASLTTTTSATARATLPEVQTCMVTFGSNSLAWQVVNGINNGKLNDVKSASINSEAVANNQFAKSGATSTMASSSIAAAAAAVGAVVLSFFA